jgi:hypothetical protein
MGTRLRRVLLRWQAPPGGGGGGGHGGGGRQLLILAGGSLLIDTPALRELGAELAGCGSAGPFEQLDPPGVEPRRRRAITGGPWACTAGAPARLSGTGDLRA